MESKAEILRTEVDEQFIEGMRNRMVTSFYKYGPVAKNAHCVDTLKSLEVRLAKFKATGNTEFLMDVANMCMILHMQREALGYHFEATDSDQSPGVVGTPVGIGR